MKAYQYEILCKKLAVYGNYGNYVLLELLVGEKLSRTYMYMTHNHVLAKELSSDKIKDQVLPRP